MISSWRPTHLQNELTKKNKLNALWLNHLPTKANYSNHFSNWVFQVFPTNSKEKNWFQKNKQTRVIFMSTNSCRKLVVFCISNSAQPHVFSTVKPKRMNQERHSNLSVPTFFLKGEQAKRRKDVCSFFFSYIL